MSKVTTFNRQDVPDASLASADKSTRAFIENYPPPAGTDKTGQAGQEKNGPLNGSQNIPTTRKRLSAQDFLEQPDPDWIIKGLIPARGIGQIFGASGTGKSFLALDIVAHVGRGMNFYGRKTVKRPCVYLVLEGGGAFKNRIRAWQEKNGTFPDNVLFDVSDLQFASEASVESFIKDIPQGSLIIIDTQSCASLGLDENSAKDAGVVVDALKRIADACNGFVLVIHHSGKDSSKGARGSSAFRAAMDTCIEVGSDRTWKIDKQKDGASGAEYAFRLEKVALGMDADGDEVSSLVAEPDPNRQEKLKEQRDKSGTIGTKKLRNSSKLGLSTLDEAMTEERQEKIHTETWRKYFYRRHTGDNPETKRRDFNKARQQLTELNLITVFDDNYQLSKHSGTDGPNGPNGPQCPATHNPNVKRAKIAGQQSPLKGDWPDRPVDEDGQQFGNLMEVEK